MPQPPENLSAGLSMLKTYSLDLDRINKILQMARDLKTSQSDIIRTAVDLLWEQHHPSSDQN